MSQDLSKNCKINYPNISKKERLMYSGDHKPLPSLFHQEKRKWNFEQL